MNQLEDVPPAFRSYLVKELSENPSHLSQQRTSTDAMSEPIKKLRSKLNATEGLDCHRRCIVTGRTCRGDTQGVSSIKNIGPAAANEESSGEAEHYLLASSTQAALPVFY